MKALRINEINRHTGSRAGGLISVDDKNLRCHPAWQNMETMQEVRLIVNDDEVKYRNIPNVEILIGEAAIDAAIADVVGTPKPRYTIQHETLAVEFIRQKRIDITDLPPNKPEEWARLLYEKGCIGVGCHTHKTVKCKDVASGLKGAKKVGRRK